MSPNLLEIDEMSPRMTRDGGRKRGALRAGATALGLAAALLTLPPQLSGQSVENLRMTFQLIEADGFQDADPSIANVVDQLRSLFRFEGYRLLSAATFVLPEPEGEMAEYAAQRLAPENDNWFDLEVNLLQAATQGIFRVELNLDGTGERILSVAVNARRGQTIVLGSSRYRPDRPTLIVALRIDPASDE